MLLLLTAIGPVGIKGGLEMHYQIVWTPDSINRGAFSSQRKGAQSLISWIHETFITKGYRNGSQLKTDAFLTRYGAVCWHRGHINPYTTHQSTRSETTCFTQKLLSWVHWQLGLPTITQVNVAKCNSTCCWSVGCTYFSYLVSKCWFNFFGEKRLYTEICCVFCCHLRSFVCRS